MPPKEKGGKKHKTAAAPKEVKPETVAQPTYEEKVKIATLMRTVTQADPKSLTRLVVHYNYQDVLLKADLNGTTALMLAAKQGDLPTVERLLSMQSATQTNVDAREIGQIGGFSALHHACREGRSKVVETLLRFGANADLQSNSALGETPLQVCCKQGPEVLSCGKALLSLGANPNAVDKFNNTAAFWAIRRGFSDMAAELGLSSRPNDPDTFIHMVMRRIPGYKLPALGTKKSGGAKKKKKKKG